MDSKTKSRIFVGIVAFIMLGSTAGFALLSAPATFTGNAANPNQGILLVNKRQLANNEILSVLSAGRVLIEYSYPSGCQNCELDRITLELFTQKFQQFVILSEFEGNETKVELTGKNGDKKQLNETISEESLTNLFCDLTFAQPRECLLKELDKS